MANQPTKYRKFVVGAASAALVASAVAPVAGAATKDFSDIKGNTHEANINALVEQGIITGYEDGTFKPNKTLTRSDVVKMMGKWLVSLGYEVPADYKTNPRFTDQTPSTNEELLKYSALVKDHGVFNGYENGSLGAAGDITRENMAIVLVRAYDAVNDTDLVAFVAEQDFKKDVTDRATAKAEARPYIDVLDYFDITNPAAPQFNPKATTTRGQFATFLYKTSTTEVEEPVEEVVTATKVESVSATNLKEVLVTFDGTVNKASAENLSTYTLKDENGATLNLKSAILQADGKSVLITLGVNGTVEEHLSNQEEATLSVNSLKSSDTTKTISVKEFVFKAVDSALPAVEKVESLGNKAFKVTFSEPVVATSSVAATFKLDDVVVSGILSGSGTRTLIVELFTTIPVGEHKLTVTNKVEDFAGYNVIEVTKSFEVVEDKVAPTVTEVKDVTLEGATVVFSEDVKVSEATKGTNYYWMNGTTKHYANATVTQIDGKTYKLTFSGANKLPAVTTDLYIANIVDYSGNEIAADTKVSINPVVDQTRPEVVSALYDETNNDKVVFTFSKDIDRSTFKTSNVVLKGSDGKVVTNVGYSVQEGTTGSGKVLTLLFSSPLDEDDYTLEVSGLKDTTTLANTMLPFTTTLSSVDVSAPDVASVAGHGNVYYVTFDNAMDVSTAASVLNPENYFVKYVKQVGSTPVSGKLPAGTNITPVNGNQGVIITLPSNVTALNEITIQGVKSANGTFLTGYSKTFSTAVGATNPISSSFEVTHANATSRDSITVSFNQPVNAPVASEFTISSGQLVSKAVVDPSDNTRVILTLATKLATTDAGGTVSYTVNAAKSLSSQALTASGTTILDSIAPSVAKSSSDDKIAIGTDIIFTASTQELTINLQENVKVKNTANFKDNFVITQANGLPITYGSAAGTFEVKNGSTLASASGDNKIVLDFTNVTATGAINIAFDNGNANFVDVSAWKLDGSANTGLKLANFNTANDAIGTLVIMSADQGAANTVITQINAAIGEVQVTAARSAFAGLSAAQQALVTNVAVLNSKEQALVDAEAAKITKTALETPALATGANVLTLAQALVGAGYTVTLENSSNTAIAGTGVVTHPASPAADATGNVEFKVSKFGKNKTVTINLTVAAQ